MATNYPTTLDTFTNPTSTDTLDSATVPHAAQHDNINDAVLAVETALGANLSNVVLPARSISTTAPLTGGGDLSANRTLAVSAGSTSAAGVLQLTDSISSTSTTTAATPNSVKSAYDLATLSQGLLTPISGAYYRTPVAPATTTVASVVNTTYYMPIQFNQSVTLDRIAITSGSTFSGSASVRLGIFANSGNKPSTVILDAGTVAPTAATTAYAITISQTLSAGIYWIAMNSITAASTNTYYGVANTLSTSISLFGGAYQGVTTSSAMVAYTQAYTATSAFATAGTLAMASAGTFTSVRVV